MTNNLFQTVALNPNLLGILYIGSNQLKLTQMHTRFQISGKSIEISERLESQATECSAMAG